MQNLHELMRDFKFSRQDAWLCRATLSATIPSGKPNAIISAAQPDC